MSLRFHWFLPTNGDGRDIVGGGHGVATGAAGAIRPPSVAYLGQIARSAEQLGFEGALTPTGRNPEIEKATPPPAPAPTQVAPRRETPPAAIEEKPKASKFSEPTEAPASKAEQKAPGKPVNPGKGKPAGKPGKPAGEEGPGHKPDEKPAGPPTP